MMWPSIASAQEQEGAIEEIVVTGSYIRGTPEDAASPVTVMSREEMNTHDPFGRMIKVGIQHDFGGLFR